jgi:hypothetical protein
MLEVCFKFPELDVHQDVHARQTRPCPAPPPAPSWTLAAHRMLTPYSRALAMQHLRTRHGTLPRLSSVSPTASLKRQQGLRTYCTDQCTLQPALRRESRTEMFLQRTL